MKNNYTQFIGLLVLLCLFSFDGRSQIINTQSFDGTTFVPTGWTTFGTNSALWGRVTAGTSPAQTTHSGAGEACFWSYNYSTGSQAIVTPPYSLQNNTTGANVSFWMYRDNGYLGTADKIDVYYNTASNLTGAVLLGTVNRATNLTPTVSLNGWYQYTFTIPSSVTASNVYLIFNGTTAFGNNTFIDDVSWTSYPVVCSGTPSSGTLAISSTTGCPSTIFNITNTGVSSGSLGLNYQWYFSNASAGTYTAISGATTTAYSNSASATSFYKMVATCSLSSSSSTTSPISFTVLNPGPCLCNNYPSASVYYTSDEEILNVVFGSLSNVSTCTTTAPGPGSSNQLYSNYAGYLSAPTVCRGAAVPFTVNAGTCAGWYGTSMAIYIDYNQNGVFTDSGELVYVNTAATQGNNASSITIPATASLGTTRMRIILLEGTGQTPLSSGLNYTWGEVEDYCVTIDQAPTVTASGGSVCPGLPFVITPAGATTYTYIAPSGTVATGPSATVNPITNTTYTITGSSAGGCATSPSSSLSGLSVIALLQSPTLSAVSSPTAYCNGGSSTLTVAGANSYTWTGLGTNASSVSVNPSVTTVYTVSGTGTNVCNGVVAVTVVVNQIPTITVNSGTLCTGYNFTFTPGGASIYTITSPSGTVNTVINPLATTNYTVMGTSSAGCASIPSVAPISTVLVIPSPTITALSGSVCIGLNFSLTPTGSNGTYSVNGVTMSNAAGAYSPAVNTTYSVSGTNNNGCVSFSPAVANVTVVPIPTITAVASATSICVGQATTNLSASGANTYTWSNTLTGSNVAVSPSVTTVYLVTGTSTLLCNSSTTINVNVWQLPPVLLNTSQNFVCVGGPSTLVAQGANTYSWSNGSSSFSTVVNPTITSGYSVTGTDLNGCKNTSTVSISVNTIVMNVVPSSTTVCLGSSFTFSASGATTYSWNGIFGFNTYLATPSGPTAYTVTAVDPNNCAQSKVVLASVYQLPVVTASASRTLICLNESATITATGANTYSWSNGASTNSIVVSPNIDITYMYTVVGTDTNNCTATASQSLVVSKCVGLQSRGVEANLWSVYPNPGYGVYTVELGNNTVKSIEVIDVTGRMILNEKTSNDKFIVNINNYPAGVYYLKVSTIGASKTIKLIKE